MVVYLGTLQLRHVNINTINNAESKSNTIPYHTIPCHQLLHPIMTDQAHNESDQRERLDIPEEPRNPTDENVRGSRTRQFKVLRGYRLRAAAKHLEECLYERLPKGSTPAEQSRLNEKSRAGSNRVLSTDYEIRGGIGRSVSPETSPPGDDENGSPKEVVKRRGSYPVYVKEG